jgi:hypothetical protein
MEDEFMAGERNSYGELVQVRRGRTFAPGGGHRFP